MCRWQSFPKEIDSHNHSSPFENNTQLTGCCSRRVMLYRSLVQHGYHSPRLHKVPGDPCHSQRAPNCIVPHVDLHTHQISLYHTRCPWTHNQVRQKIYLCSFKISPERPQWPFLSNCQHGSIRTYNWGKKNEELVKKELEIYSLKWQEQTIYSKNRSFIQLQTSLLLVVVSRCASIAKILLLSQDLGILERTTYAV